MALHLILLVMAFCQGFVYCQEPDASSPAGWEYRTSVGADAAFKLESLPILLLHSMEEHVKKVNTTNNASEDFAQYKKAVDAAKGTNCAPSDDDQYRTSITLKISHAIDTCAAFSDFSCGSKTCALIKLIKDALLALQTAESDLANSISVCTSFRVPPSPSCLASQKKYLDVINDLVSESKIAKYKDEIGKLINSTIESFDKCIENGLKSVREELNTRKQSINDCVASLTG
uniref:Protein TsetseEP domain-containing protein n=1 Tax=Graphocephala atropunctata TaxID=36148 RepID=A0A1B6MRQ8_9HEMI